MSWNIESGADKLDKYEWKAKSSEEDQVMTDTVAPDDINVQPEQMDLNVNLAPSTEGIHSGVWKWSYQNQPDSNWYITGNTIED